MKAPGTLELYDAKLNASTAKLLGKHELKTVLDFNISPKNPTELELDYGDTSLKFK